MTGACSPPAPPLDPATVVAAVLDHCHGPLQGKMGQVQLALKAPDGALTKIHVDLPDALRVNCPEGRLLLVGGDGYVLGEEPRRATASELERLSDLRTLVDAAALGPLYRATGCEQLGDREFRLLQPTGDPLTLHVAEEGLIPARLGDVAFAEHLRTPVARIAKRVSHPRLGDLELHFVDHGIQRRAGFFAAPELEPAKPGTTGDSNANPQGSGTRIRFPTAATGGQPKTATLVPAKAASWLLLDDPGHWQARHETYTPLYDRLTTSGQRIAGFPILTTVADRAILAIPFRARRKSATADLPENARVREFGAGQEVEIYPPTGDLASRRMLGAAALEAFVAKNRLEAIGPIACQPFVHLHEGPPGPEKLAKLVVRMSVRVR